MILGDASASAEPDRRAAFPAEGRSIQRHCASRQLECKRVPPGSCAGRQHSAGLRRLHRARESDPMQFRTIGIMTPGDMGQAIAMQLKAAGFDVSTALEGRSERSRALARAAGIADLGSIARLVAQCDLVLSIMNPAAAAEFATDVARALKASAANTLVVDCNAVSPQSVRAIADMVNGAGGRFIDAGIIGAPPRGGASTTLYVSGPQAADLQQLAGPHIAIRVLSERVGDASALKMCSAALTKARRRCGWKCWSRRNARYAQRSKRSAGRSRAPISTIAAAFLSAPKLSWCQNGEMPQPGAAADPRVPSFRKFRRSGPTRQEGEPSAVL